MFRRSNEPRRLGALKSYCSRNGSILDPSHPTIYLYRLYLSSSADFSLSISLPSGREVPREIHAPHNSLHIISSLHFRCLTVFFLGGGNLPSRCAAFVWLVCWCSLFHASQKDSCMAEAATVFEIDLIFVFEFDPIFVFQNDPIFVFQNDPSPPLRYMHCFRELLFRLDGNLYGRRTAGSVYRNELEEVKKLNPAKFQFVRGEKDPTVFRCTKTGIILIHHVDDIRAAGPEEDLAELLEQEFPKYCEIQCGDLERVGTAVEVLGRTKIRTNDAILTLADPCHIEAIKKVLEVKAGDHSEVPSKQLNLLETSPLNEEQAKAYRSAVGSAIYLGAALNL